MEELKKRIKQLGIKQKFIANRVGVGEAHLTMMLNGNATMPENVRNAINELLSKVLV